MIMAGVMCRSELTEVLEAAILAVVEPIEKAGRSMAVKEHLLANS